MIATAEDGELLISSSGNYTVTGLDGIVNFEPDDPAGMPEDTLPWVLGFNVDPTKGTMTLSHDDDEGVKIVDAYLYKSALLNDS